MFLVNSRFYLFSAASSRRHPFSRSYEVILPSSLTRVLSFVLGFSPRLPVSVCGTGTMMLPSSFSCQREIPGFATFFRSASHTILSRRTSLPARLCACPGSTINRVRVSFCVPASVIRIQVVLESQPVVHRLRLYVLGLGPDLPWVDEPSPGNLRLSTAWILTRLSLLIPAFSLPCSPHCLPVMLLPACIAPLPMPFGIPKLRC